MSEIWDWYRRNPKKFIRGVRGLGPDVIGAYAVILDLIYEDEDSCPNDPLWIGGILGCSARKARSLIATLVEKGKLTIREDGRLINFVAVSELENRAKQRRRLAEAGANGGRTAQARRVAPIENNDLAEARLKHREERRGEEKKSHLPSLRSGKCSQASAGNLFGEPDKPPDPPATAKPKTREEEARSRLYERGREVFGRKGGSIVTGCLRGKKDNVHRTAALIEDAAEKRDPTAWIYRWLKEFGPDNITLGTMADQL